MSQSQGAVDGVAIAEQVRTGATTATEVAYQALATIEAGDGLVNSFTSVLAERALSDARRVDALVAAGLDPGPLAGVPVAVKNLFDVAGEVTVAGSRINADHKPAEADAVALARLTGAGAVLVGSLNMDEFAYGFTTENTHYGPCHNPHDLDRVAGGSSGGSGAAVAAGFVPVALGSDTNGSVRVPATLCGVFGLKPTYGRISRRGMVPFCPSLDHVGILARSVRDLAVTYDVLDGPDPDDPVTRPGPGRPGSGRGQEPVRPDLRTSATGTAGHAQSAPGGPESGRPGATVPDLGRGIEGLRLAVADDYFARGAVPEALEAVATLARALGIRGRVTLPEAARARSAAMVITASEGAQQHLAELQQRPCDFDPMTRDRFLAGALVPATAYLVAQRFRRWYRVQVSRALASTDVLLAPATPFPAPLIGQREAEVDGEIVLTQPYLGCFTQPLSFIGLPVVTVPVVNPAGGLPLGVQLVAAPDREAVLLRVAAELERRGLCAAPVVRPWT